MQESLSREHHPLPSLTLTAPRGPQWWGVAGGLLAAPRGERAVGGGQRLQAADVDAETVEAEQEVGDCGAWVRVAHPGATSGAGGGEGGQGVPSGQGDLRGGHDT